MPETYDTGIDPEILKSKHKEIVKALAGLTVAQAALVLDIVREDIGASAVISN